MPNEQSLAALAQLALIQEVDTARAATHDFKLPGFLRAKVDADEAALDAADNNTVLAEGDRAGDSVIARGALTALEDFLREGCKFLGAIRAPDITEAQRLEAFTAYGWARGLIGRFSDARTVGLARIGVRAHAELPAAHCYPPDLVADLTAQLAIFEGAATGVIGADRLAATRIRNVALAAAQLTLARVRFYYCCASLDADQSPELARIGFQPRRAPGAAAPKPPAPPTV